MLFYFNLFTKDPTGIAGTIKIKKEVDPRGNPRIIGSIITDIDGNLWYLRGQVGQCVLARPYVSFEEFNRPTLIEYRTYEIEIVDYKS